MSRRSNCSNRRRLGRVFASAVAALAILTAPRARSADLPPPAVVPLPVKLERTEGVFTLTSAASIQVDAGSRVAGDYLAEQLRKSTGYPLGVSDAISGEEPRKGAALLTSNSFGPPGNGIIILTTKDAGTNLGSEGYELTVAPERVVIRAPSQAGLFYGVQTFRELLPVEAFASNPVSGVAWRVPSVRVSDQPRFKWRGMMLDVSRHFFTKAEVERLLDEMALHKLNMFHWHLVDDQGWRIEIKKYPRLTEIGAWRPEIGFGLQTNAGTAYGPDGRYGGYYTQADIREIVAYARSRCITVVPEIEMPGHSMAALAAYPEYSCAGGPFKPELRGGVFNGIYCPGNEATFTFLQDVLTEVFELFPGPYVHIGGDEVPKGAWKKCQKCQARIHAEGLKDEEDLQGYFTRRIEKFISSHGRTLIGWSEIQQSGMGPSAVVMDWKGGGLDAARAGHEVVMTPGKFCYLDHYQSRDHSGEPKAIGGFLPLNQAYAFDPIPAGLAPEDQTRVLGGQANLWTEYVASFAHVEYMAFPRLCALAEVTWSPSSGRDWDDFMRRLKVHAGRLDRMGIHYRANAVVVAEANPFK